MKSTKRSSTTSAGTNTASKLALTQLKEKLKAEKQRAKAHVAKFKADLKALQEKHRTQLEAVKSQAYELGQSDALKQVVRKTEFIEKAKSRAAAEFDRKHNRSHKKVAVKRKTSNVKKAAKSATTKKVKFIAAKKQPTKAKQQEAHRV